MSRPQCFCPPAKLWMSVWKVPVMFVSKSSETLFLSEEELWEPRVTSLWFTYIYTHWMNLCLTPQPAQPADSNDRSSASGLYKVSFEQCEQPGRGLFQRCDWQRQTHYFSNRTFVSSTWSSHIHTSFICVGLKLHREQQGICVWTSSKSWQWTTQAGKVMCVFIIVIAVMYTHIHAVR